MGLAGARKTVVLLGALALCGCSLLRPLPEPAPATATLLPTLPAASLGATRAAQQVLHAAFGDRDATMQCLVDVTPARISVIGLNAVGLRLFSVKVENGQTTVERSPGVPDTVQPARILADIELAYWPLTALQTAYANTPWQVSEPFPGTRRLLRDGRLIAEVHYAQPSGDRWQGRLWLSNFEFGYSLAVDSQPVDE